MELFLKFEIIYLVKGVNDGLGACEIRCECNVVLMPTQVKTTSLDKKFKIIKSTGDRTEMAPVLVPKIGHHILMINIQLSIARI